MIVHSAIYACQSLGASIGHMVRAKMLTQAYVIAGAGKCESCTETYGCSALLVLPSCLDAMSRTAVILLQHLDSAIEVAYAFRSFKFDFSPL